LIRNKCTRVIPELCTQGLGFVHSQNSPSLLHITSGSITGNTSPQNPYCHALNNLGTVWFVEGIKPEAKIWWQPCLGIEYAWNQWDNWTYTQKSSSFFLLRWRVGWCEDENLFFFFSHYVLICRFQEDNIGQRMLDKMRCYWEHVEEYVYHSVNWEHNENKMNQKLKHPPTPSPKE
jgi:hypothetical protein